MTGALLLALIGAAPAPAAAPDPPAAQPAAAPPAALDKDTPAVTATLEPKEVRVGEPIRFQITLLHDGGHTFRMPETLDTGPFELVDRQAAGAGPPGADGRVAETIVFTLALFEPGSHRLPDVVIPYLDRAGLEFSVTAPAGVVRCKSVIANLSAPELKPPPGPVSVIVEDLTLLWIAGLLAALLLSSAVAFVLARWHAARQPAAPAPPPVPAEVIARGRLQTLRAADLPGQGLVKEFFLELSHILREYFGNRYSIHALEMTTAELLEFLTAPRLKGVAPSTVAYFLDESDLVKFAKHRPTADEIDEIFRIAEEVIDRTTPRPAPPLEAAA